MSPVFRHGRLRLYLLKLLDEAPKHGYEVIRLLQDRFMGVYAPSPGTIYPRLARLEEEGLVTHDETDGRKVYRITEKGRAEIRESQLEHRGMSPEITAGDVDVDVEDAYFTGDEAPGGDNPTPDQDVVDDIGKALGVEYQDAEELKAGDKVVERDRHRWELDPASSEDYKDRK